MSRSAAHSSILARLLSGTLWCFSSFSLSFSVAFFSFFLLMLRLFISILSSLSSFSCSRKESCFSSSLVCTSLSSLATSTCFSSSSFLAPSTFSTSSKTSAADFSYSSFCFWIPSILVSHSKMYSWYPKFFFSAISFSRRMYSMALFLGSSSSSFSFSTSLTRFSFSLLSSSSAFTAFLISVMGCSNLELPMMSSKYSSMPVSSFPSGPDPLGFICAICSTSPCRMRNLLCVRSTPLPLSSVETSANLVLRPLIS